MAITFVEARKKQKKLLLVFGIILILTVIVLVWGLRKKIPSADLGGGIIISTFRKPEINFTIFENNSLKNLEPFEKIKEFGGKSGRDNPFISY